MQVVEVVKLNDWLVANKESLETEGSSFSGLSRLATSELGFRVTTGSIKAGLKAAGIKLKHRKASLKQQNLNLLAIAVELASSGDFTNTFIEELVADPEVPQGVKDVIGGLGS